MLYTGMCILSSPHISIYYSLTRARFRVCVCVCVVRVFTATREKRKKSRIQTRRRRREAYVTQTCEYLHCGRGPPNLAFSRVNKKKMYLNPKRFVQKSVTRATIFIFVAQTRRGGSTFEVIFSPRVVVIFKRSIYTHTRRKDHVLFFTLRCVLSNVRLLLVSVVKQSTTREK